MDNFELNYWSFLFNNIFQCIDLNTKFWGKLDSNISFKYALEYADDSQKDYYIQQYNNFKHKVKQCYKYYIEDIRNDNWGRIEGVYRSNVCVSKIFEYQNKHFIIHIHDKQYIMFKIGFDKTQFYYGDIYLFYNNSFNKFQLGNRKDFAHDVNLDSIIQARSGKYIDWGARYHWEKEFVDIFWERTQKITEVSLVEKCSDLEWLLNPFQNIKKLNRTYYKNIICNIL